MNSIFGISPDFHGFQPVTQENRDIEDISVQFKVLYGKAESQSRRIFFLIDLEAMSCNILFGLNLNQPLQMLLKISNTTH